MRVSVMSQTDIDCINPSKASSVLKAAAMTSDDIWNLLSPVSAEQPVDPVATNAFKAGAPNMASHARHPTIRRQYFAEEAFAECLSTNGMEAFFQQCPATELTDDEVKLLNSLISVSESLQAALPQGVSLQEWAERRIPNGFERQINSSGLVYVSSARSDTPIMPSAPSAQPSAVPWVAFPPVKKVVRLHSNTCMPCRPWDSSAQRPAR